MPRRDTRRRPEPDRRTPLAAANRVNQREAHQRAHAVTEHSKGRVDIDMRHHISSNESINAGHSV